MHGNGSLDGVIQGAGGSSSVASAMTTTESREGEGEGEEGLEARSDLPKSMSVVVEDGKLASACNRVNEQSNDYAVVQSLGDYELLPGKVIGHGTFSKVFEGYEKHTKAKMAIKAIRLDNPSSFYHEVKMNMLAQGSPSVVLFRESCVVEGVGYLVHDLCCYGEVFHHIVPHVGLEQRELIGPFFAQLVDALTFLHARGVCHLDIKLENMFVDRPGHMRLGDFGLSALAEDGPVHGCRGSLGYAAPENLRSAGQGLQCAGYDGLRADVWSCGVVLFVMLYGNTPWDVASDSCAEYRMYKATDGHPNVKPWNRLTTVIRSLFHRTLAIVPNRRSTAAALKGFIARDCGWHPEPRA